MPNALKSPEGKWILFAVKSGEQAEFWPIDAKAMLLAGSHTREPPAGVTPVVKPAPPRNAGAPQAAVAQTFVAEDGTAPAPKAKAAKSSPPPVE